MRAILILLALAGGALPPAGAIDTTCPSPNDVCPDWWRPPYFTGSNYPDGSFTLIIDAEAEWADFRAKHGGHMLPELDLATHWALVVLEPLTPGTSASVRVESITRDPVLGHYHVLVSHTNLHVEALNDFPVEVRPADMAIVARHAPGPVDVLVLKAPIALEGGAVDLPDLGL